MACCSPVGVIADIRLVVGDRLATADVAFYACTDCADRNVV